ncbi:MAG: hypothetical protein A2Z49_08540 [Chloroflexi bacterium RBG_19FT_COMBO_56_12]|nr:MAG: hypothetical protein A2Z49_08540 [Chloroflexi bacterium RBG_19FT_COMBO_56_12]
MYNKFFRRHSNLFLLLGTALVLAARNRVTQPPDSPTSSPALTTSPILAAPPPTPDLSSLITIRSVSSTYPDGKWEAGALLVFFARDTNDFEYTPLPVAAWFWLRGWLE